MRSVLVHLSAILFLASPAGASVIEGPVGWNGHDYYVLASQTWWDAEAEAVALGGHLVAVNDQAEQDFVYSIIMDSIATHWIGYTDQAVEGVWLWTNGDTTSYTNWNLPWEPNNYMGIENCGAIEVAWGGKWNDLRCDVMHPAVVETDGTSPTLYQILRGESPTSLVQIDLSTLPWTDPEPVLTPPFPALLCYQVEGIPLIHLARSGDTVTLSAAWPNSESESNSDPWIIDHHDELGVMQPRVLVLNFSNTTSMDAAAAKAEQFVRAIGESTRWHGYENPAAEIFLDYEIDRIVDLRDDPPVTTCDGNSTKYPRKPGWVSGNNFEYSALYDEPYTTWFGYPDPEAPGSFLSLSELVNRGFIHELWFFANHGACGAPYETIELKQYYDGAFQKTGHGPAGNGHDEGMPWIGRSFRITFINPDRGIGCAMENLGHALEGMRHYGAIPYYTGYFTEYAGFDLDVRWGLPFSSFYALGGSDSNEYPDPTTLISHYRGSDYPVDDYYAIGGNVHFTPNGRSHYDLWSPDPVMSTIKSWRMGNGPGGEDLAEVFTIDDFGRYGELAPDCMGPWLVYWRQNMPGLGSAAEDDAGAPMKNWWPFLFY